MYMYMYTCIYRLTEAPPDASSSSSWAAGGEEEGETKTEPAFLKKEGRKRSPASARSRRKNWEEKGEKWTSITTICNVQVAFLKSTNGP